MSWSGHIFLIPFINSSQMPLMSNIIYSEIRCIVLCVLQTSMGFWVFLFRQSF